ncbi:hypothetical protein QAD02_022618 [Eretmocerus hayati]|uniref:Uncharacterized protein n=1 Tax=Eretmocerus hayati TaxID=131215 RepID=A0ACC2PW13_9HYME|nr:hypothetical protein QAD02_022618 [Eretmocerus hayati]
MQIFLLVSVYIQHGEELSEPYTNLNPTRHGGHYLTTPAMTDPLTISEDSSGGFLYSVEHGSSTGGDNQQKHTCLTCGKAYTSMGNLTRHLNHECGQEKRYHCRYCNYRVKRKDSMKRHTLSVHRDIIDKYATDRI